MAYNPAIAYPKLLVPSFTDTPGESSIYTYASADAAATVDNSGYFTDAKKRGLKAGDVVLVTNTSATPPILTVHRVVSILANGSADLADSGATLSSANAD